MRALVTGALLLAACREKEVPFKPPPPQDADAVADTAAATPIDAPAAAAKVHATKLAVGDHTSCAVMNDATLRCWGKNTDGQLGIGTTADAPAPVMPPLRGVKDVVLGTAHACALLDDSSVTCWGRINFGGKADALHKPTAVPGLAKAERVFAVGTASCASLADGSLVCWGDVDVRGHLRLSGGTPEHRVPTPAAGLERVVALSANGALHADGTVSFWRTNGVPEATGLTDVVEIASSGDVICGLRKDGTVACAGPTQQCASKQPAKPATKPAPKAAPKKPARTKGRPSGSKAKPKPAPPPPPPAPTFEVLKLPRAKRLAFDVGLCVVTASGGRLQCLDSADGCQVDDPWPGLAKVDSVSGNCARSDDGSVRCWSVEAKARVVSSVAGVARVTVIAASSSHACALVDTGEIYCWGSNKFGALGRGESDAGVHREASAVAL